MNYDKTDLNWKNILTADFPGRSQSCIQNNTCCLHVICIIIRDTKKDHWQTLLINKQNLLEGFGAFFAKKLDNFTKPNTSYMHS